jgi:hypothetical protein
MTPDRSSNRVPLDRDLSGACWRCAVRQSPPTHVSPGWTVIGLAVSAGGLWLAALGVVLWLVNTLP